MSQVTLTWAVNNMTRVINDGFVIVVDWSCTAGAVDSQTPPQPLPVGAFYGGSPPTRTTPASRASFPTTNSLKKSCWGGCLMALALKRPRLKPR